jgi:hypothetical protein
MADPKMRASDADRDRTAALLREHMAEGRLTPEEFNERLDKTYEAKTLGELDELMSDLPGIDLYKLPDHSLRRHGRPPGGQLPWRLSSESARLTPAWQAAWGGLLSVSLLCFVVWLLSGRPGNLWFLWVAGPWAAITLARWIGGGRGHGHRPGDGRSG